MQQYVSSIICLSVKPVLSNVGYSWFFILYFFSFYCKLFFLSIMSTPPPLPRIPPFYFVALPGLDLWHSLSCLCL